MEKEEIGKAMFEMSVMENKLKQLDQQLGLLEQHIIGDERAESGLEEFRKGGKSEVVLPIGGGIFAKGSLEKMEKAIVSIGANILVEKDFDDSRKFISKRKERMMGARADLANQVKNILEAMAGLEKVLRAGTEAEGASE